MGVLDDEQLVRPLQELEHGGAHRVLGDPDQVARVDLTLGADRERRLGALVVSRGGKQREDLLDLGVVVAGVGEPLTRPLADETLRARAGVQAAHLDADHPAHAVAVRERLADQVVDLLGREVGDRRPARDRELGPDRHLGAHRLLALDDRLGDVLGELLDVERLVDHQADGLGHRLGEARHVDALLGRDRDRRSSRCRRSRSSLHRRMRMTFSTPVTPARVSARRTSGSAA